MKLKKVLSVVLLGLVLMLAPQALSADSIGYVDIGYLQ